MPNPVAEAVTVALSELRRAIAPQQRIATELRGLAKLRFTPPDAQKLAAAIVHLTATIGALADEAAMLDTATAMLRRANGRH